MIGNTRRLADLLRQATTQDESMAFTTCIEAAAAIDALLDAIEAGGMVQPRPAPVMDLGPLRELRAWHGSMLRDSLDPAVIRTHHAWVRVLNSYFPEGDRL